MIPTGSPKSPCFSRGRVPNVLEPGLLQLPHVVSHIIPSYARMVLAVSSLEELQALSTPTSTAFIARSTESRDSVFYILGFEEESDTESIGSMSEEIFQELFASVMENSVVIREDIHMSQLSSCSSWLLLPMNGLISPDDVTSMDLQYKEEVKPSLASSNSLAKTSYKDMLSRHIDQPKVVVEAPSAPKHKWEPKFVLQAAPKVRIDRKYGPQPNYVDANEGKFQ